MLIQIFGVPANLKTSVFICTSLDGFIARKDGTLDWLDKANALAPKGEDCGFRAFMDSIDVLVMGRKTFEQVLTFGEWVYGATRVIVMSRGKPDIPNHLTKIVSSSSETPTQLIERLSAEGAKHLYIDGGFPIQQFLKEGQIDEVTITIAPVVLGEGKPLFEPIEKDIELVLLNTKPFDFGFVQVKYAVKKASSPA